MSNKKNFQLFWYLVAHISCHCNAQRISSTTNNNNNMQIYKSSRNPYNQQLVQLQQQQLAYNHLLQNNDKIIHLPSNSYAFSESRGATAQANQLWSGAPIVVSYESDGTTHSQSFPQQPLTQLQYEEQQMNKPHQLDLQQHYALQQLQQQSSLPFAPVNIPIRATITSAFDSIQEIPNKEDFTKKISNNYEVYQQQQRAFKQLQQRHHFQQQQQQQQQQQYYQPQGNVYNIQPVAPTTQSTSDQNAEYQLSNMWSQSQTPPQRQQQQFNLQHSYPTPATLRTFSMPGRDFAEHFANYVRKYPKRLQPKFK